jgi:hypothetical protein
LQYTYVAIHALAAAGAPRRAGVGIVAGGKGNDSQSSDPDLLRLSKGEKDGIDPWLWATMLHGKLLRMVAI